MTCRKDCAHYDVCVDFTKLKDTKLVQDCDIVEERCDHFLNKADLEKVTRCEACEHKRLLNEMGKPYFCTIFSAPVDANHFCGYGIPQREIDAPAL